MKRRIGIVAVVVVGILALVLWRWRHDGGTPVSSAATSPSGTGTRATAERRTKPDPRTLAGASITGKITNEAGMPVAGARVCGDASSWQVSDAVTRAPICSATDDAGGYKLGKLVAATYRVSASAPPYKPGAFHPDGKVDKLMFELAVGEAKAGVDIVLRHGGVEITGVVSDLTGGPVAHAEVRASAGWNQGELGPMVEADDQGKFSLWVKPGPTLVTASAEGYASNTVRGRAPGTFEIVLTPESSLAGTVIDAATSQPLAGVRVSVGESQWSWFGGGKTWVTDVDGKFRVDRLTPGRYTAVARSEHGYGRSEGSTLLGLGQHVDGVVVKLFPARQISGVVMIASETKRCEDSSVSLNDAANDRHVATRREPDHSMHADAVLPGTYSVTVRCEGYQSRDHYDKLVVADQDLTDLVWEVDPGGKIRGHVTTKSGEPIEDAELWASNVGGTARDRSAWSGDRSKRDGSFELAGLKTGTYRINLQTERGIAPHDGFKVDVPANGTVDKDIVLDDGGKLRGTVVDEQGKPVAEVNISAAPLSDAFNWGWYDVRSDAAGTFMFDMLRAGDYRVTAQHSWAQELKKPGTTDDAKQGEKTTVRVGQTSTVTLVVESQSGTIKGSVVDSEGKPVSDAFVSAAHESDAAGAQTSHVAQTRDWWGDDNKPVLTRTDGAFTVTRLAPGKYTVRAYRKGGGEAVLEHVAVNTTARLQIKDTGSIEGIAKRGSGPPPDELQVALSDLATGYRRTEQFYMTGGRFTIRDLPKGHFHVDVTAGASQRVVELDLAEAEHKTGVEVTLDSLVTITGRLVELGTQKPVAGIYVFAELARGGGSFRIGDDDTSNISDETGHFTVKNAPAGQVQITGVAKNWQDSDYGWFRAIKTATGSGTVDIGDVTVIKRRIKPGDAVGDLGLKFVEQPETTPPEDRERRISYIDPAGPAARTALQVGDVVTTVDGVDVTGVNSSSFRALTQAPPGTKLTLGVGGTVVAIVLAAP